MGARLEAARTRLDLAELAHALGEGGQARAMPAEAVDLFRDLGLSKRAGEAAAGPAWSASALPSSATSPPARGVSQSPPFERWASGSRRHRRSSRGDVPPPSNRGAQALATLRTPR